MDPQMSFKEENISSEIKRLRMSCKLVCSDFITSIYVHTVNIKSWLLIRNWLSLGLHIVLWRTPTGGQYFSFVAVCPKSSAWFTLNTCTKIFHIWNDIIQLSNLWHAWPVQKLLNTWSYILIKEFFQNVFLPGFHLSAAVSLSMPRAQFNVAVTFDRQRIVSCNCTCSSTAHWCSHIVAVCLYRIHLVSSLSKIFRQMFTYMYALKCIPDKKKLQD